MIPAIGLLSVATIAVVVIVLLNGLRADPGMRYRQKLAHPLAPVVIANRALSTSLRSLHGQATGAAAAVDQAQQSVASARGAMNVLSTPNGSKQLSRKAEHALAAETGYLQAVGQTVSTPSTQNISQLPSLTMTVDTALASLSTVSPQASASLSGTVALGNWASARVAAAARANAAADRTAQRRQVQHAGPQAARQNGSSNSSAGASSTAAGYGVQDLPVQCGYGVAGSAGVSCSFAENAFYGYWTSSGGNATLPETISVWSAEAQTRYQLTCSAGDGVVDCTGTNGSGVALDARFSQSATSAYTASQAAAYAASGKLGP